MFTGFANCGFGAGRLAVPCTDALFWIHRCHASLSPTLLGLRTSFKKTPIFDIRQVRLLKLTESQSSVGFFKKNSTISRQV